MIISARECLTNSDINFETQKRYCESLTLAAGLNAQGFTIYDKYSFQFNVHKIGFARKASIMFWTACYGGKANKDKCSRKRAIKLAIIIMTLYNGSH